MVKYLDKKVVIQDDIKKGDAASVFVRPGDKIELGFDIASVDFNIVGGDIVFQLPNGGELIFVSMAVLAFEKDAPSFVSSTGQKVELSDLIKNIDEIGEVPVDGTLTNSLVKLENEFADATLEDVTKKKSPQDPQENQGVSQNLEEAKKDNDEEDAAKLEEDYTGYFDAPAKSESPIIEYNPPALSEAAPIPKFSSDNSSSVDSQLTLDVGVYHSQSVVDGSTIYGGGGSHRSTIDSSSEAQIEKEFLDFSDQSKKLTIHADNPELYSDTFLSKVLKVNPTQPVGFQLTQIKLTGLPDDITVVNGEKQDDGSWIVYKEGTTEDGEPVKGFTIGEQGAEIVLKYNLPSVTDGYDGDLFAAKIDVKSEYDINNVPEEERAGINEPDIKILDEVSVIALKIKDAKTADDYEISKSDINQLDISSFETDPVTGLSTPINKNTIKGFVLSTNPNDNYIIASQGDTTIYGSNILDTDDTFIGQNGNDTIHGGLGDDLIEGGEGDDYLNGGSGIDTLSYENADGYVNIDLSKSTPQVTGSVGKDTIEGFENIKGSSHSDTLKGDADVNTIYGGAGNDSLDGNSGNDTLYGENGNDTLTGGEGEDHLFGQGDNDTFLGSKGNDVIDGGEGSDTLDFSGATGSIVINMGDGQVSSDDNSGFDKDTFTSIENITGGGSDDTIDGDANNNTILGGDGSDTISGYFGNDTLD
ncbi:MAG: hypothetical protein OIF32_04510, partial [Campylobacterales bacterium]|nr:hypothetical protein [Campylobacterales bacterium]